MWKLNSNKGQITIDAALAIIFLLLVSLFIYHNILDTVDSFKYAEIADRAYAIANAFENYALIAYSKNTEITVKFEPIGTKNYTIYFSDKKIVVDSLGAQIRFIPEENYVRVEGDIEDSGNEINGIRVDLGKFYVNKTISINISG